MHNAKGLVILEVSWNGTLQPNPKSFLVSSKYVSLMPVSQVLKSLKESGNKAVPMVNFQGEERANRVFLAAWILDKEEQNLIAGLGAS